MRWDQGRPVIDRMLASSQLQRVPPVGNKPTA